MILIAAFAMLITSISANVDDRREAAYGQEAPAVVVERDGHTEALEALKGKWVLLSFWSTTDAESRLTQNRIASIVNSTDSDKAVNGNGNDAEIEFKTPAGVYSLGKNNQVEVLSVNLDPSASLMNEVVDIDNLLESTQTRVTSKEEIRRLCNAYEMNSGLRSFIIDPEGKVAMADPDEASLRMLLASR